MRRDVLILDDSRMVRAIAAKLIENLGLLPTEAATGDEALIRCERAAPAAILVDWNMPDMDGPAFIARLRAIAGIIQPRVLLMSTETRLGAIRAAMRSGADSYLLKPFDRDKLAHRLMRFGLI